MSDVDTEALAAEYWRTVRAKAAYEKRDILDAFMAGAASKSAILTDEEKVAPTTPRAEMREVAAKAIYEASPDRAYTALEFEARFNGGNEKAGHVVPWSEVSEWTRTNAYKQADAVLDAWGVAITQKHRPRVSGDGVR